ncbi:MAG: hypothetical protein RLZZ332_1472, partial [Actinomycetota bacterium]
MFSPSSTTSTGALTTNERRRVALVALAVVGFVLGAYALTQGELPDPARPVSLLLGAALGFTFERGRFCFFCLYRDAFERRITRPLLSVVTALAVGAIGYALLFGLYLPNPKGEGLPPAAHISPVSLPLVAGACAFGLGMVLSGACISGHLYRIGQGYLRAIPALVGALVGFGLGFFSWNTLYLEQVSESPVWWLPRWLGYAGSLMLLLVVLGLVAWALLRVDRSEPVAPHSAVTSPLGLVAWALLRVDRSEPVAPHSAVTSPSRLFDVLFARRWSPVATGVVVGAIGIAAYLRSTPLGVTSQLSTVSRSYLDSREMLPEVLHGIDMMRGCVAIVASNITNNGWLVIGFVIASFVAAMHCLIYRDRQRSYRELPLRLFELGTVYR